MYILSLVGIAGAGSLVNRVFPCTVQKRQLEGDDAPNLHPPKNIRKTRRGFEIKMEVDHDRLRCKDWDKIMVYLSAVKMQLQDNHADDCCLWRKKFVHHKYHSKYATERASARKQSLMREVQPYDISYGTNAKLAESRSLTRNFACMHAHDLIRH